MVTRGACILDQCTSIPFGTIKEELSQSMSTCGGINLCKGGGH